MSVIDILIAIPIIFYTWRGFSKGFIIGLASIAILIIGIYFGSRLSLIFSEFLSSMFEFSSKLLPLISFLVTILIIIVAVYAMAHFIEKSIKLVALGFVNRLLGAVFGFVKILLIVSIILYFMTSFNFVSEKKRSDSLLWKPVSSVAEYLITNHFHEYKTGGTIKNIK